MSLSPQYESVFYQYKKFHYKGLQPHINFIFITGIPTSVLKILYIEATQSFTSLYNLCSS